MKFELNRPIDYSDEAFISELNRVSKIAEGVLSRDNFNKHSKYSASTIEKRFGSWSEALKIAKIEESSCYTGNSPVSKEEVITELQRVAKLIGNTCFSQKEFTKHSQKFHRNTFARKFSTFNLAMKEAGFTTPTSGRKYTEEECFENLLNVWTYYSRQPNYAEMKVAPSIVGPKAYLNRWGTWGKALMAFLEKVNSDVSIETTVESKEDEKNSMEKVNIRKQLPEDRRDVPWGLRFTIFMKDRFKCVICGRSPATTLGIELHADHIIPFSKGGKTREDNLRTLCNECNIGKSNRLEE